MFAWRVQPGALRAEGRPQVEQTTSASSFTTSTSDALWEKALNMVRLSQREVGRSFALVAGVSDCQTSRGPERTLPAAAEDIRKLTDYLRTQEFFDGIVVLRDDDVTIENLSYFLHQYFPARLRGSPKSRFLFGYSGHGMTDGARSYLLTAKATSMRDAPHSLQMSVLRSMMEEIIDSGHHVLVLLNSCFGGAFIRRSFGSGTVFSPRNPGAHAITAGGTQELTWHDARGDGQHLLQLFAGLDGAPAAPRGGQDRDGGRVGRLPPAGGPDLDGPMQGPSSATSQKTGVSAASSFSTAVEWSRGSG